MKPIISFAIGAVTFAALQIFWGLGQAYGRLGGAWIMKTTVGIGVSFAVFVGITTAVCACYRKPNGLAKCIGAVGLGGVVAMSVALFLVGPGNLWPIVIAFDGAIIGAAVAVGVAIGMLFRGRDSA